MSDAILSRVIRDELANLLGIRAPEEEMLAVLAADAFIRLPGVLALTGLSTAQLYRDMAANPPRFPKAIVLGPNQRAWRLSEIKAWQAERVAARDSGADAELRAVNPNIGKGRVRRHQTGGAQRGGAAELSPGGA